MKSKIATQLENIATQFAVIISDQNQVISMLEKALSDEIMAAFQYWTAANMTNSTGKIDVDPQFIAHAKEEFEHAEMLAQRIKQLGAYNVPTLQSIISKVDSHAKFGAPSHNAFDLVKLAIESEKDAIALYKNLIEITKNNDPTTCQIAKDILQDEEQHKYDLEVLLTSVF